MDAKRAPFGKRLIDSMKTGLSNLRKNSPVGASTMVNPAADVRPIPLNPKPLHEHLRLNALDKPSHGGASHRYAIHIKYGRESDKTHDITHIDFQQGPVKEHGVNGISDECLLAILIDRLQGFQSGPYACPETFAALCHLEAAMSLHNARTKDRIDRGVEGTSQP